MSMYSYCVHYQKHMYNNINIEHIIHCIVDKLGKHFKPFQKTLIIYKSITHTLIPDF